MPNYKGAGKFYYLNSTDSQNLKTAYLLSLISCNNKQPKVRSIMKKNTTINQTNLTSLTIIQSLRFETKSIARNKRVVVRKRRKKDRDTNPSTINLIFDFDSNAYLIFQIRRFHCLPHHRITISLKVGGDWLLQCVMADDETLLIFKS